MAYTLEFEIAGDNNGSGGTGTATFYIDVDGTTTNLGTFTTPTDTTAAYDWGARSVDVSAAFDPSAREVVVRWSYSSGLDAVRIRNLRITDGVNEWLDQWGEQGLPWGHAHPWAGDGGNVEGDLDFPPTYYDWWDFASSSPASMGNPFGTGYVQHLIRTQAAGDWVLKFDIAPDHVSTGGASHYARGRFYIDVDGTTTNLGIATSPTEKGNDGTFDFGEWTFNITGLFDPATAANVKVRWTYTSGIDAAHVKNLRIESNDGLTVYGDQYWKWGDVGNSYVAADGGDTEADTTYPPVQADHCGSMPTGTAPSLLTNPYGDYFAHHIIRPAPVCFGPTVGYIGSGL